MCAQLAWRIAHDLLCYRCGYNLRTLSRSGICPECAEAVSATIRDRETRPFKLGRTSYIAAVVLCYAAPLLIQYSPLRALVLERVWWLCFFVAMSLAVIGFARSTLSLRARYSLPVFLATLASYVYLASLAFLAS